MPLPDFHNATLTGVYAQGPRTTENVQLLVAPGLDAASLPPDSAPAAIIFCASYAPDDPVDVEGVEPAPNAVPVVELVLVLPAGELVDRYAWRPASTAAATRVL